MLFISPPHKKIIKQRFFPALLSLLMAFNMLLPAAAETADITGAAGNTTTQTIDIYVTKSASFAVKLPVSVTLEQSNGTGTASYSVFVKGDVEDGSSVTVGPQADTISFKKTKGNTATALTGSITQAETTVDAADITTSYPAAGQLSGSISVNGITAGQWKGQMVFTMNYTAPPAPAANPGVMSKSAVQAVAREAPSITFNRRVDAPSNTTSSVDVSAAKDGSVMAHTLSDGSIVIGADGWVLAPEDMSGAFEGFKATSIELNRLKTDNVTDMSWMFSSCSNLTFFDVSTFNTSNVTNMQAMFSGCSQFLSLDIGNFDTQKVTNMSEMFKGCSSLQSLDLKNFKTSNVTNVMSMFENCSGLASLYLNNFDVSSVTESRMMFGNCNRMTLYVSDAAMETWVKNTEGFPTKSAGPTGPTSNNVVISPSQP